MVRLFSIIVVGSEQLCSSATRIMEARCLAALNGPDGPPCRAVHAARQSLITQSDGLLSGGQFSPWPPGDFAHGPPCGSRVRAEADISRLARLEGASRRPGASLGAVAGLSDGLQKRLRAAGVESGQGLDPWEAWLRLRAHGGRRATLVDLYELEAARQGIRPEELPAADRQRLKATSLHARRDEAEVVPGTARPGDPHEVTDYNPDWPAQFRAWRDRLAAALGQAAVRIDHVGSTSVPGLAAKPVIDVQVSVPDVDDERPYLCSAESVGLVLQLRERGHRFLLPPAAQPRDVHVHVCSSGGVWERDHLLFRDYLRAHPSVCENYAALKKELIVRWRHDRKAYGDSKTGFVLDTLADAAEWAMSTGWRP